VWYHIKTWNTIPKNFIASTPPSYLVAPDFVDDLLDYVWSQINFC
jgi:hypothetical protein